MNVYFFHSNNIEIYARIESKTKFVKMQGSYVHNNKTGTYECNLTNMGFWVIVLKGNSNNNIYSL